MGFLSNLTGGDQRRDISKGYSQANALLDQGYGQSQGYYDQASGLFDPYMQQGVEAAVMYADLLGLNGADARTAAQGVLTSDPLFSGQLAADSNAMLRQLNARGQGAGGLSALAGQRVLQENYGNWLDRYNQAGQQGFQAAGAKGNVLAAQGDNAYGFAATKANNAIGQANAMASTRNVGMNNLLGAVGTGLNALSKFYKPV